MLNEKEAHWLAVVIACDLTIPGVPPLNEGFIDEAAWKEFTEIYGSKPPAQPFITNKTTAQLLPMENWLSYNSDY